MTVQGLETRLQPGLAPALAQLLRGVCARSLSPLAQGDRATAHKDDPTHPRSQPLGAQATPKTKGKGANPAKAGEDAGGM